MPLSVLQPTGRVNGANYKVLSLSLLENEVRGRAQSRMHVQAERWREGGLSTAR